MIVPNDGPVTLRWQTLDDDGQPTGEVKTIPGVIALALVEHYQQADATAVITGEAFREFSIKLQLVVGALREFYKALGIPITRTPLERHLSARMSRVRCARQRR